MREILPIFTAGFFGLLFGLGLVTSHMTDPDRVIGFLDVMGDWDPSLAFVMIGAIAVAAPAFVIARKRDKALLGDPISLPKRSGIDMPLVLGAAIFGVGWGLAGICPGPGIALLGTLDKGALYFVPAVIVGMFAARLVARRV
ncbi:MAG: DUF6691 family protein [Alphaproteobacteria bacterium]|jgi:uncharacterized membrane protein YedE/YeeE